MRGPPLYTPSRKNTRSASSRRWKAVSSPTDSACASLRIVQNDCAAAPARVRWERDLPCRTPGAARRCASPSARAFSRPGGQMRVRASPPPVRAPRTRGRDTSRSPTAARRPRPSAPVFGSDSSLQSIKQPAAPALPSLFGCSALIINAQLFLCNASG